MSSLHTIYIQLWALSRCLMTQMCKAFFGINKVLMKSKYACIIFWQGVFIYLSITSRRIPVGVGFYRCFFKYEYCAWNIKIGNDDIQKIKVLTHSSIVWLINITPKLFDMESPFLHTCSLNDAGEKYAWIFILMMIGPQIAVGTQVGRYTTEPSLFPWPPLSSFPSHYP